MPIIIVTNKERLKFRMDEKDESIIYYRRLPPTKRAEMIMKHTSLGEVNNLQCQIEMCEFCILGWEKLYDSEGTDIPYDEDIVKLLPTEVILRIMARINESSPDEVIKNLAERSKNDSFLKV